MTVITRCTDSAHETQALAAALAELAEPGDLVVLVGDLGAGKTCFVQGFAAALGVTEPVTSPTFALVHNYTGTVPVFHADLYRLVSEHEVLDLGVDEALSGGAIGVVEWADRALDVLPQPRLAVTIRDAGENERVCTIEGWDDRADALDHKTRRWQP